MGRVSLPDLKSQQAHEPNIKHVADSRVWYLPDDHDQCFPSSVFGVPRFSVPDQESSWLKILNVDHVKSSFSATHSRLSGADLLVGRYCRAGHRVSRTVKLALTRGRSSARDACAFCIP